MKRDKKEKCDGCKRAEGSDTIYTCNCGVPGMGRATKDLFPETKCKYVKREGESCTLNNNCKFPNCST